MTLRDQHRAFVETSKHDGVPRYRAELWVRPYSGWMVACTRWVDRKSQAVRDGHRFLNLGTIVLERD